MGTPLEFRPEPDRFVMSASPVHLLLSGSLRRSHTFALYAHLFRQWGLSDRFLPFEAELEGDRVPRLMDAFRNNEAMQTIMVSDPFKARLDSYLDKKTERALQVGSVNLIRKHDELLVGDNLDGVAFLLGIGMPPFSSLALFGCGGVSSAVAHAVAPGMKKMAVIDVDPGRERSLSESLQTAHPGLKIERAPESLAPYAVLYNGTGLGKAASEKTEGLSPLPVDATTAAQLFLDAVYTPAVTPFLQQGLDRGARIENGLRHMLASTTLHCRLITGREIELQEVEHAYRQLHRL